MSGPSLYKLRKGVVLFTAFLVFFVIYGMFFSRTTYSVQVKSDTAEIKTSLCRIIVSEKCVEEDTFFSASRIAAIHALSSWDSLFQPTDTIFHTWYAGSERIQTVPCDIGKTSCRSSLSMEDIQGFGEFSVDMIQQNVLLSTVQFHVNP